MALFQVCRRTGKPGAAPLLALLLGLSAGAYAGQGPGASPPTALPRALDQGVALLRSGRYRAAEVHFGQLAGRFDGAPEPHYYTALSLWWQGVYEEGEAAEDLRRRFDASIERAIELAGDESNPRGQLVAGSAYLLRAQVRARDKQALKAGWDARRGKKALEAAARSPSGRADVFFGLGAYNYYAAHVNALVKGLRLLLFIPGGDAALGIRQLETAASLGSRTQVEAHLLLALIFSSEEEGRYGEAVEHARHAASLAPGSPAVRLALAEILDGTGAEEDAIQVLEVFLADSAAADFDFADVVRADASVHLARLLLRRGRPVAAAAALQRTLIGPVFRPPVRPKVQQARGFLLELEWELGETVEGKRLATGWGHSWPPETGGGCGPGGLAGLARLEATAATTAALARLAAVPVCPEGPPRWQGLVLGGALTAAGLAGPAREILAPVAANDAHPGEIRGWSRLLLGRLAATTGRHEEARHWFRQAEDTRGFSGEMRARYYLGQPTAAVLSAP